MDRGGVSPDLIALGPVRNHGGTGSFPRLGAQQRQYAQPRMRCTGEVTCTGQSMPTSGDVWPDHQWGALPDLHVISGSLMKPDSPNGDRIGRSDASALEQSRATIPHPDGTHAMVPDDPPALSAGRFHQSPASDYAYPAEQTVTIPSPDTVLPQATTPVDHAVRVLASTSTRARRRVRADTPRSAAGGLATGRDDKMARSVRRGLFGGVGEP